MIKLDDVDQEGTIFTSPRNSISEFSSCSFVIASDQLCHSLVGSLQVLNQTLSKASAWAEVSVQNQLYHSLNVETVFLRRESDLQISLQESFQLNSIFANCMSKYLVNWFKNEFYECSLSISLRSPLELFSFSVEVVVSPKKVFEDDWVNRSKKGLIFESHRMQREHERVLCGSEDDVSQGRRKKVIVAKSELLGKFYKQAVDFFEGMLDLEVSVFRRQLHFDNQPIDFIDDHYYLQPFSENVLHHFFSH